MHELPRPTAFISYSHGDEFSKLLADNAEEILNQLGFEPKRYKKRNGLSDSVNFDATGIEWSVRTARSCDLTVAIILRICYGWVPMDEELPDEMRNSIGQHKSMCRLEYEAALRAGRPVFAMQEQHGIDVNLETNFAPLYIRSLRQWSERPNADKAALSAFHEQIQQGRYSVGFGSVAHFREQLRALAERWKSERRPYIQLMMPEATDTVKTNAGLVRQLADRFSKSGRVVVSAPRGMGATSVVCEAALRHRDSTEIANIVRVECRDCDNQIVEQRLRSLLSTGPTMSDTWLRSSLAEYFGAKRNILILDGVQDLGIRRILPGADQLCTTVIVTDDRRVVTGLDVPQQDQFDVPRISEREGYELLRHWLPNPIADAEQREVTEIVEALAGWPYGLRVVQCLILDEYEQNAVGAVARVLRRIRDAGIRVLEKFDSNSIKIIQQLTGSHLPTAARQMLGAISVLPASGFSSLAATIATGIPEEDFAFETTDLRRLMMLKSLGPKLWLLEREARDFALRDESLQTCRAAAESRLEQAYLDKIRASSHQSVDAICELIPDAEMVLEKVMVVVERDLSSSREYMPGIRALVRRTGSWATQGKFADRILNLAGASLDDQRWFWLDMRGTAAARDERWAEAIRDCEEAIDLVRSSGPANQLAKLLTSLGKAQSHQKRHALAVATLLEALELEMQFEADGKGHATVLHQLAHSLFFLNRRDEGLTYLRQSIDIGTALGDHYHLSMANVTWAKYLLNEGDRESALSKLDDAEKAANDDGNPHQLAFIEFRRGVIWHSTGNLENAAKCMEAALGLAERTSDIGLEIKIMTSLASVFSSLGESNMSQELYGRLIGRERNVKLRLMHGIELLRNITDGQDVDSVIQKLVEEGGDTNPRLSSMLLNIYGGILQERGENESALSAHEKALRYSEDINDSTGISISIVGVCHCLGGDGRVPEAIAMVRKRLSSPDCYPRSAANLWNLLGVLSQRMGDNDEAMRCANKSLEIEKQLGGDSHAGLAYPLHTIGHLLVKQLRYGEAIPYLQESLRIERTDSGTREGEMKVLHTLARAQIGTQNWYEAEFNLEKSLKIGEEFSVHNSYHQCQVHRTIAKLWERTSPDKAFAQYEKSYQLARQALAQSSGNSKSGQRLERHIAFISADLARLHNDAGATGKGVELLTDALEQTRNAELIGPYLYLASRLSQLQDQVSSFEYGDPVATLLESLSFAMEKFDRLHTDFELRHVVTSLFWHLRASNREKTAATILEQLRHQEKFPRLQLLATSKIGLLLWNSDDKTGAASFYERQAKKFLDKGNFYGVRRILLDWLSARRHMSDLKGAASQLQRWIDALKNQGAAAEDIFALVLRKGEVLRKLGEHDEVLRCCEQADEIASGLNSQEQGGFATLLRARASLDLGNEELTLELLLSECRRLESQGVANALESPIGTTFNGNIVSDHAVNVGRLLKKIDPDRARVFLRNMLQVTKSQGNVLQNVAVASELARIQAGRNYVIEAEKDLNDAARFAIDRGELDAQACIRQEIALLFQRESEHERASFEFKQCLELRRTIGNPNRLATTLRLTSQHMRNNMDQAEAALRYAEEALLLQNRQQSGTEHVRTQMTVGAIYKDLERFAEAETILLGAVENSDRTGDDLLRGACRLTLAAAFQANGKFGLARTQLVEALACLDGNEATNTYLFAQRMLGRLLYDSRRGPEAVQSIQQFMSVAEANDQPAIDLYESELLLANAYRICGLLAEALARVEATLDIVDLLEEDESEGLSKPRLGKLNRSLRFCRSTILLSMNRPKEALSCLEKLDDERLRRVRFIEEATDFEEFPLQNFTARAKAHAALGEHKRCVELINEANQHMPVDAIERSVYLMDRSRIWLLLGEDKLSRDDADRALETSLSSSEATLSELTRSFACGRLALISLNTGQIASAVNESELAMRAATHCGSLTAFLSACEVRARILIANSQPAEAAALLRTAIQKQCNEFATAGMDGDLITKSSVTLHWLLLRCLQAVKSTDLDAVELEVRRRQRVLEERGVVFVPLETGDVTMKKQQQEELNHEWSKLPSVSENRNNDLVLAKVESFRSEGTNPGIYVRLDNGTSGFCPSREAFVFGGTADPTLRFQVGKYYPFNVKSAFGADDRGTLVLSQSKFFEPIADELENQIVEGYVTRPLQVEKYPGVEVALDGGELLKLRLRRDVAFGRDEHLRELWTGPIESRPRLRLRLEVQREPHLRILGSARVLFEEALEHFISTNEPVSGRIIQVDKQGLYVHLTPAVIGFCPQSDAMLKPGEQSHLKNGAKAAFQIKSYNGERVELTRASPLRARLDQALKKGKAESFLGKVVYHDPNGGYALMELTTDVTGIVWREPVERTKPPKEFFEKFPMHGIRNVWISASNHKDQDVQVGRKKLSISLRLSSESNTSQFESGRDFFEAVAKPTIEIEPLVFRALENAYHHTL